MPARCGPLAMEVQYKVQSMVGSCEDVLFSCAARP